MKLRNHQRENKMSPLNNTPKKDIIKRISFVEEEIKDLQEYKDIDWKIYAENRKKEKNWKGL